MEGRLQPSSNSPTMLDIEEGRVDIIDPPSAGEQCCHYFRCFIQFLFSYVGLTAMLCGYLILGAIVFRSIEAGNEEKLRVDIRNEMEDIFNELWDEAHETPMENWTDRAIRTMSDKQKNYTTHSVVFLEYLDDNEKWSFFGSMLFSLTVLSTIGYGHIAPLTVPGQLFCMLYALIGIPLMLLVLTNVGRVMATSARLLYRMYTSRLCRRCCGKHKRGKKKKRKTKKKLKRKGSNRVSKPTKDKKKGQRKGSKKNKKGSEKPRQTIVNMDNQTKLTNQRPLSLNMEMVSSPSLPPPYDESNEMAEKLSEGRGEGEDSFTDTMPSRRSLGSLPRQQSLVNIPRPVSVEIGEGSTLEVRSDVVSLCSASEMDRRSPSSLTKSESYESASSLPFPANRTESSIELGGNTHNKSSFPRQQSCIEFRQFDRGEGGEEERRDGDGSEGDSSRTPSTDPKSISRQSSSVSRFSQQDPQTYPRAKSDKRKKRRGESTKSVSSSKASLGINHKNSNTLPRRWRGRKKVMMKPPSLKTLHHHRNLRLIDSTLAIRLATYDKMMGSSREDLATIIPEFSCGENAKLLNEIAMKGFDPRPPPPPPESEQPQRERMRKGKGKRRKTKSRRGDVMEDELGTIYEGSESDASEARGTRDLEVADIPMWPVLLLLFGYITAGAIFFYIVEQNWNFFDAFYFCFITLTTIGFGDLVPDTSLVSLISCCVYTMIGMAVTSMCIALIMKKFVFIVKGFGRKIGIIRD